MFVGVSGHSPISAVTTSFAQPSGVSPSHDPLPRSPRHCIPTDHGLHVLRSVVLPSVSCISSLVLCSSMVKFEFLCQRASMRVSLHFFGRLLCLIVSSVELRCSSLRALQQPLSAKHDLGRYRCCGPGAAKGGGKAKGKGKAGATAPCVGLPALAQAQLLAQPKVEKRRVSLRGWPKVLQQQNAAVADRAWHGGVAVAGLVGAHPVRPPPLGGALIPPCARLPSGDVAAAPPGAAVQAMAVGTPPGQAMPTYHGGLQSTWISSFHPGCTPGPFGAPGGVQQEMLVNGPMLSQRRLEVAAWSHKRQWYV